VIKESSDNQQDLNPVILKRKNLRQSGDVRLYLNKKQTNRQNPVMSDVYKNRGEFYFFIGIKWS